MMKDDCSVYLRTFMEAITKWIPTVQNGVPALHHIAFEICKLVNVIFLLQNIKVACCPLWRTAIVFSTACSCQNFLLC